jgi:hypothetical protein
LRYQCRIPDRGFEFHIDGNAKAPPAILPQLDRPLLSANLIKLVLQQLERAAGQKKSPSRQEVKVGDTRLELVTSTV